MNALMDNWINNRNTTSKYEIADTDVLMEKLSVLNQKEHTQLILEGTNSYLVIGGGAALYNVSLVTGNEEAYFTLINPNEQNNFTEIDLVTGGQLGTFMQKIVVDYDTALKAGEYYLKKEERNPELSWEEE